MTNTASLPKLLLLLLALLLLATSPASLGAQQLSDVIEIRGVVRDANGDPIVDVSVSASPATAEVATDAQGRFTIELPPGSYRLQARHPNFEDAVVELDVSSASPLVTVTMAAAVVLAEIDVAASYGIDRSEPIATGALSSTELLSLPRLGNDLFRGISAIPGVTGNDTGAQFNVRGGLVRDSSIFLDGLEIFEPYHLKDYQGGIFSIVDPDVIGSLDLIPGGLPSEYGDKMAGVLDMTVADPGPGLRGHVGMSLSSVWAAATGRWGRDDQSRWRFSARRGFLDLVSDGGGEDGQETIGDGPQYWDFHGKLDHSFSDSHSLAFSVLTSDDSLMQTELEPDDFGFTETEQVDSTYGNSYAWLTHQGVLSDRLFANTLLSSGIVDQDRRASDLGFGLASSIRDARTMDVFTLRQDWNQQLSDRHFLKWGAEARSYDVTYDYLNELAIDGLLGGNETTRFAGDFSSTAYSAYFADRFRLAPSLVLEAGVRYDQQSLTDDDQISPRFNLIYDLEKGGVLRASWGSYYQSQRPNELQVEDGETSFLPAERATTATIGWERSYGRYNVRADGYYRDISSPRPFYANIFDITNPNPETTRDRIRIAPESSAAHGLELFVTRRAGKKFDWWASYTWSEVTDQLDGVDTPRFYDQSHALSFSGTYRLSPKWSLTALFNFHTGWPTTAISGRTAPGPDGDPIVVPVLGTYNAQRLDDYHRLDLRVSRFVKFRSGRSLELFVDVQNLYGRDNQAGFVVDDRNFAILPNGEVQYTPLVESWLGVLPSFGVSFRF